MDADHLDIYGDTASIEASFVEFADKVKDKKKLFVAKGLPLEGITVAVNDEADYKAFNIRIENSTYVFDVQTPSEVIKDIRFNLPGKTQFNERPYRFGNGIYLRHPDRSHCQSIIFISGCKT
jgi:UDP-N-acetylmuramate--alanine ligase